MSYQDGLDWLARNVHKWPESILDGTFRKEIMWIEQNREMKAAMVGNPLYCYSKPQWLARRAELQNKPSWAHAPEWAQYLAQNCIGLWTFTRFEPRPNHAGGWSLDRDVRGSENRLCVNIKDEVGGEVLGDWRDTLERRPADLSEPAITERLTEAAKTVLAAAPALMGEKFSFDRNDWFERGELPPVGAFVDVTGVVVYGDGEKGCEVLAHVENCAVIRMSWGFGCFESKALSPRRTDRDALIDAVHSATIVSVHSAEAIADAILAVGFRREWGAA